MDQTSLIINFYFISISILFRVNQNVKHYKKTLKLKNTPNLNRSDGWKITKNSVLVLSSSFVGHSILFLPLIFFPLSLFSYFILCLLFLLLISHGSNFHFYYLIKMFCFAGPLNHFSPPSFLSFILNFLLFFVFIISIIDIIWF